MPLVKVISVKNLRTKKLILAKDLEDLKAKAEVKLGYKIEVFKREQDDCEIDDDDAFLALCESGKEFSLIAFHKGSDDEGSPKSSKQKIKVFSMGEKEPIEILFESLEIIKSKAGIKFGIEVDKVVRKDDGTEIDDDEVLVELMSIEKNIELVVLEDGDTFEPKKTNFSFREDESVSPKKKAKLNKSDEENEDEDEDEKKFENAFKKIEKISGIDTTAVKSTLFREELDDKIKKIEYKNDLIIKENKEKHEKFNKLQDLLKKEIELKKINEEYDRKLETVQATVTVTKKELDEAKAKLQALEYKKMLVNNVFHELRQAEKVDICFMLDCTGSMSSYIDEAKMVIHNIVDKLKKMFNDFSLRMAFVGYKDHNDGAQRVIVLPFTNDPNSFKPFVSSISTGGGDDQCEDVFGGLEEVGKLEWTNLSRVLFHIGDAPCHGERFHSGAFDSYPAGDPRGLKITDLIRKLISLNVCYYFAEINSSTIKMIEEFDKELIENQGNKINVVK